MRVLRAARALLLAGVMSIGCHRERVSTTTAVIISAILCAGLITRGCLLLAAQGFPAGLSRSSHAQTTTQMSARTLGEQVLRRSMFDSRSSPMSWSEPARERVNAVASPKLTNADESPECGGPMRLVASVVGRDPHESRSTIELAGARHMVRVGAQLDDERQVLAIGSQRVLLSHRGRAVCSVSMFRPAQAQVAVVSPPTASAAAAPAGSEIEAGIAKLSETQFRVARSALDKLLASPSEMMRLARGQPHVESGRTLGLKLALRAASPLRKLGIQNGDVLRSINGFDLATPDGALEAYSKLREQQTFSISILRAGKPVAIEVSID